MFETQIRYEKRYRMLNSSIEEDHASIHNEDTKQSDPINEEGGSTAEPTAESQKTGAKPTHVPGPIGGPPAPRIPGVGEDGVKKSGPWAAELAVGVQNVVEIRRDGDLIGRKIGKPCPVARNRICQ